MSEVETKNNKSHMQQRFASEQNNYTDHSAGSERKRRRNREKVPNESIDNDTRLKLLNLIKNTCSIRQAAK